MPPRVKKPTSAAKVTSSEAKPSSKAASNKKRAHGSDSESDLAGPPSKKAKSGDDDQRIVSVLKRRSAPVDPHSGYVGVSTFSTIYTHNSLDVCSWRHTPCI